MTEQIDQASKFCSSVGSGCLSMELLPVSETSKLESSSAEGNSTWISGGKKVLEKHYKDNNSIEPEKFSLWLTRKVGDWSCVHLQSPAYR